MRRSLRLWLAAAAAAASAVILYGRLAAPIITDGDFAVTELYTQLATRGRLLFGPYSRFGWHHPGPLYFYLAAPFYAASGHRAATLYAFALALNLAAIAGLAAILLRKGRRALAAGTLAGCALLCRRSPMLLASPWTGHVPVIPSLLLLVAAAAAMETGASSISLVAFALIGSFISQTHVAFVPIVAVMTIGILIATRMARVSSLIAAFAASWSIVVLEAVVHRGGNVNALLHFFAVDAAAGHSLHKAFLVWSFALAGVFRRDFYLGWGGHFAMTGLAWAVPLALGQVTALAAITADELRRGRQFQWRLSAAALAASLVALLGLTRITGDILDHDVYRIAALGAFNLGLIAAWLLDRLTAARHVLGCICVAATVFIAFAAVRDLNALTGFERRRLDRLGILGAHAVIENYIRSEGIRKPLFEIDRDKWGNTAGILLRLQQDGIPAAVQPVDLPIFTTAFAPAGDEDALITVADLDFHRAVRARPNTVVLRGSAPPFISVRR